MTSSGVIRRFHIRRFIAARAREYFRSIGAPRFFWRFTIARCWNSAADLPDVSKCFRGLAQSIHASDHHATLHGVVFDILVGSEHRVGLAAVFPVGSNPPTV
jgi:hypothetical protein